LAGAGDFVAAAVTVVVVVAVVAVVAAEIGLERARMIY